MADLRELSADIVFIGCDGLTVETGLTTPHVLVAEVGATMVARAPAGSWPSPTRRSSAGAGSRRSSPLTAVHVLVTDEEADPAQVERARDAGIEVILA